MKFVKISLVLMFTFVGMSSFAAEEMTSKQPKNLLSDVSNDVTKDVSQEVIEEEKQSNHSEINNNNEKIDENENLSTEKIYTTQDQKAKEQMNKSIGLLGLTGEENKSKDKDSLFNEGLKTLFFLVILLAGFWWAANWLKKSGKIRNLSGGHLIECTSIYSVGTKEKIIVVKVRDQEFLVGVTQHSINALAVLGEGNNKKSDIDYFQRELKNQMLDKEKSIDE